MSSTNATAPDPKLRIRSHCANCGAERDFTAVVSVILVEAPALSTPYPLIPADEYRLCSSCGNHEAFVSRAVDAHPMVRNAGPWTRALIVFADFVGHDVQSPKAKVRPGYDAALAGGMARA
jgi:ribosomal protein S14